jgi:glyceraldehyde 3-phosphate dehydrogenase
LASLGIHGLGRIGRALLRVAVSSTTAVTCLNDNYPDDANLLYLLQYDSRYGRLPCVVSKRARAWQIDGRDVAKYSQSRLSDVPWADCGARIVIDASGAGTMEEYRDVLADGVDTVILTRRSEAADITLIRDVNGEAYDPRKHRIVSASTCDAVALATAIAGLGVDNVESGSVVTVHPWLSNQNLLDAPSDRSAYGKDYAMGRSAHLNILPRSTSILDALGAVMPNLATRMMAMSYRVPTDAVSSLHVSLNLGTPTDDHEIFSAIDNWCGRHPETLQRSSGQLVSGDFLGSTVNGTIDLRWTGTSAKGQLVRTVVWYDNEVGYANHVLRLAALADD